MSVALGAFLHCSGLVSFRGVSLGGVFKELLVDLCFGFFPGILLGYHFLGGL